MKSKLFQYTVIWHPNEKQEENGESSKIVVELSCMLAKDEKSAVIKASRTIPDIYMEDTDQLEVVIRPIVTYNSNSYNVGEVLSNQIN